MAIDNILLATWTTPFGLAPFDQIKDADFVPAFEVAMTRHLGEIDVIAGHAAPATFANTIEALELAGADLTQVGSVFWNLAGADSNDARQAIEREMAPKMAQHGNAITSNATLFRRVDDLFLARASLGLTAEQLRVLERTHLGFVRSGAKLAPSSSGWLPSARSFRRTCWRTRRLMSCRCRPTQTGRDCRRRWWRLRRKLRGHVGHRRAM
jgi:peptidyl-dipeptidase Dcp